MGASSSINATNPPKIHICKPLINEKFETNIDNMETILQNIGFQLSSTNHDKTESNIQNNIFVSNVAIVCIARCTMRCFHQLRELDYIERCYKKCLYVMLDDKYNPDHETWINKAIRDCPWVMCAASDDIENATLFLSQHIRERI
jgi:hypothetical protein